MAWLLWVLEFLACRLATDVLAVSPSLAAECRRRRLASVEAVHVLGPGSSNGVDLNEFVVPTPPQKADARRSLGVPNGNRVVGFVGRVHEDKGINTLVTALVDLNSSVPVTLLLAGGVEDARLLKSVENRLAAAGISSVILGHVREQRPVFWAMDLLVLPSRREGFPNVVLEAAACGVPALVSDATGCRDAVVDGRTGWIFPLDRPGELTTALRSALADEQLVHQRGSAAREWVAQSFDRKIVWERIDDYLGRPADPAGQSPGSQRSMLAGKVGQ